MAFLQSGTTIRLWLHNGFHYGGKVLDADEQFVRLHDQKSNGCMLIALNSIARVEEVRESYEADTAQ